MDKLMQYVHTVHAQIDALVDPSKPEPSQEQLYGYTAKVVGSLKNMTSSAPPEVKNKVRSCFGSHWNVETNSVGSGGISPLILQASFANLKDQLKHMRPAAPLNADGTPAETKEPKKKYGGEECTEIKILEDRNLVGRIVGPEGKILQAIQLESGCKLDINGDTIGISGPREGAEAAMKAIDEIIKKGFSSLIMGENSEEATIKVHPRLLPTLLGKEWCNMRAIKEKLHVEVGITDNGNKGGGKGKGAMRKATLVLGGDKKNVEKAKEVINSLTTVFYHEITHQGMIYKEVPVEHYWLNLVIGKGGSEIKHMQKNFDCQVFIPGEASTNENVVIVGDPTGVQRCEKHITTIISKAENRPQRGEEGYNADDNKAEEIEDWMQDYMYKR